MLRHRAGSHPGYGGGRPRFEAAQAKSAGPLHAVERHAVEIDDKVRICERAFKLLTEKIGFPPEDIIFDPNILTVATGIEEHNNYAVDFIESIPRIKAACPGVHISGGVSNVSFSFRGNDVVREAIHAVFLYHAIRAGLDMGIVNAGQLAQYEDVPPDLLERVE